MQELDEADLLVSAQRPQPRKLSREDACSPQHLPYLKAVLKASIYSLAMTVCLADYNVEVLLTMRFPSLRRDITACWTGQCSTTKAF